MRTSREPIILQGQLGTQHIILWSSDSFPPNTNKQIAAALGQSQSFFLILRTQIKISFAYVQRLSLANAQFDELLLYWPLLLSRLTKCWNINPRIVINRNHLILINVWKQKTKKFFLNKQSFYIKCNDLFYSINFITVGARLDFLNAKLKWKLLKALDPSLGNIMSKCKHTTRC